MTKQNAEPTTSGSTVHGIPVDDGPKMDSLQSSKPSTTEIKLLSSHRWVDHVMIFLTSTAMSSHPMRDIKLP